MQLISNKGNEINQGDNVLIILGDRMEIRQQFKEAKENKYIFKDGEGQKLILSNEFILMQHISIEKL